MVAAANAMDRTVFVYTSDHGYHSGQWAVPYCKMLPYVEDVRIPFFVRLPPSAGGAGGGEKRCRNAAFQRWVGPSDCNAGAEH